MSVQRFEHLTSHTILLQPTAVKMQHCSKIGQPPAPYMAGTRGAMSQSTITLQTYRLQRPPIENTQLNLKREVGAKLAVVSKMSTFSCDRRF